MKRIIAVIMSMCVLFAVVFACVSYIDYSNRPDALSEACGIELSDVVANKNILNFHKDGFYVYAKLSVNDREIDKIIERLTAARYVLDDTKNERVPDKSFLGWWDVNNIRNKSTYILMSSRDGDLGTTVPTVTEIHFCDTKGENTIVYIGYYKWSFV